MRTKEVEVWVEVEYKGRLFLASTMGRIKRPAQTITYESIRGTIARPYSEKILNGAVAQTGYLKIGYSHGSSKTTANVHSIIAKAFLGERPYGSVINHKNGIKTDNRPDNLEYCSNAENIKHAFDLGLNNCKGVDHHSATLTSDQLAFIRENLGKLTQREIANQCGVGEHIISNVKLGKTYSPEKKIEITESQFWDALNACKKLNGPGCEVTPIQLKEKLFPE